MLLQTGRKAALQESFSFGVEGPSRGGRQVRGMWGIVSVAFVGTALLAVGAAWLAHRIAGPRPEGPASRPAPFSDLDAAIAAQGWHPAWVVHRPPDLPGPYRVVGGTTTLGNDPGRRGEIRYLGPDDRWVSVELEGHPDFYQMAIGLEVPDGRITGAVLRRPPDPVR